MYNNADRALRYFWKVAKGKLPFNSYSELKTHYRTDYDIKDVFGNPIVHDTFFKHFEGALKYIDSWSELQNAMDRVAKELPKNKTPNTQTFYNALSSEVESFTFSDVKNVASDTLDDSKNALEKIAIGGVGLWALQAVGAYLLIQFLFKKK